MRSATRRLAADLRAAAHAERALVEMCREGERRQAIALARELLGTRGDRFAAAVFRAAVAGGLDALAPAAREAVRSRHGETAFAAAYALGRLAGAGSLAVLVELLASRRRSARLRAMAAEALGELGDARAERALLGALRDPAAEVRLFAAFALGSVGSERSVPALLAVSRSGADVVRPYGSVAGEARRALRRIRARRRRCRLPAHSDARRVRRNREGPLHSWNG